MKKIFEPAKLGRLTLKNRLIRSATWEGLAKPDGGLTDELYDTYSELARGGVGAIIIGFTSVASNDIYFGGMARLSDDRLIPQYRKLVEVIHAENVPVIVQLALGGFYRQGENEPTEPDYLTAGEIHQIIEMFGDAARRAAEAGFDGIQIHAAHFFFLSRFISPAVNHRTDSYGGSVENRARILLEILKLMREKAPGLHITIKINSSDFIPGGLDEFESMTISKMLAAAGIDSIEVSGNGTSVPGIKAHVNEAYFLDYGMALAENVDVPVILVGGMRALDTMEKVVNSTKIEFISLSRPLIREPNLPDKFSDGEKTVADCISCNACYRTSGHTCIFVKKAR